MSALTENPVLEVKKKRGRKPKSVSVLEDKQEFQKVCLKEVKEEKTPSKRGRKTKTSVPMTTSSVFGDGGDTKDTSYASDDENIIVNLKVHTSNNKNNEGFDSSGSMFPAYDSTTTFESTPFPLTQNDQKTENTGQPNNESSTQENTTQNEISGNGSTPRVIELLKEFEMKNKCEEWPQNTAIACYWCCHKFPTVPYGLPIKHHNGKFYVYGCFCSLECVTAYNFNSKEKSDEMWERYNLINLLSRKLGGKSIVRQAPPREALVMFGGKFSIEEYRKYINTTKLLTINFPPMMTITQQIEEINDCDVNSEYRYIPIDQDRLNKYKEKLTLKRSKPLTNFKHTLDHLMNLKIAAHDDENEGVVGRPDESGQTHLSV